MANIAYRRDAALAVGGFGQLHIFNHVDLVKKLRRAGWKASARSIPCTIHLENLKRFTLINSLKSTLHGGYWKHRMTHLDQLRDSLIKALIGRYPIKILTIAFFLSTLRTNMMIIALAVLSFLYLVGWGYLCKNNRNKIKACLASYHHLTHKLLAMTVIIILGILFPVLDDVGKIYAMYDEVVGGVWLG